MTKLYTKLARVYHEMYQSIFDYKKEYRFYSRLLKKYKCKKILEIGCGSGNIAKFFLKENFDYIGMDKSTKMLNIAKETEPKAKFVNGDMRKIKLRKKFDAVIITGRSFTYMTENDDVMKALSSVNKILVKNGILIFDNFDAQEIFTKFNKRIVTNAKYHDKKYKRIIKTSFNLESGWTWNLDETYFITEKGKTKIIKDKGTLRAFTEDELNLFLKLNKFKSLETIKNDFKITIVARK